MSDFYDKNDLQIQSPKKVKNILVQNTKEDENVTNMSSPKLEIKTNIIIIINFHLLHKKNFLCIKTNVLIKVMIKTTL